MEKRELTCIGCPMGCQLSVELDGGKIVSIAGYACEVGNRYAENEVLHPERTVTSTIYVEGGDKCRVSCKTKTNIPKDKIDDCMAVINKAKAVAPISIGDVLIENVCGTGVDVVATRNITVA